MTALNYFGGKTRAFILQDAAKLNSEGLVTGFETKTNLCPAISGAVGFAGPAHLSTVVVPWIGEEFGSIDALIEGAEGFFVETSRMLRADMDRRGWAPLAWLIVAAGWSVERDEPRAASFMFDNDGAHVFTPDVEDIVSPFVPREDLVTYFDALVATGGRESFEPSAHGLFLLRKQRHVRQRVLNAQGERFAIGGHVVATEIGRDGVSQRIIHRWPEDRVGEPIRPDAHPPAPKPMNRAERRRMAKFGGKP